MFFSDCELNAFENTNIATPAMHAEKYSYLNILLLIAESLLLVTIYQLDLPPLTN